VTALVARHGNAIRILGDGRAHDVGHAAVVTQVHDFRAARLQQSPDHVDGRVMAVEKGCRRDEAQRPTELWWFHVTGW
jgi:hypothetical protein